MARYRFLLLIIVTCGGLWSCKNHNPSTPKIKEGTITYEVKYLSDEKENPMVTLLPATVDLKFKSNNISLFSEGYLGFFSTHFISSYKGNASHLLLKVLNNRFDYAFPQDEIAFIYQNQPEIRIEYCDSTKNIAGYNCKMAVIHCPGAKTEKITAFYTHEISIKDPNRNTPFKDLKGVLMEFKTSIHNIETHFVAVKVSDEKIADAEFTVPEEYKKISEEEIKKFLLDFN
ncbi:MAG: hypothetical protein ACEPOZ_08730 [Marinifilaceae bacterium]|jgi:GLPGLI family protein